MRFCDRFMFNVYLMCFSPEACRKVRDVLQNSAKLSKHAPMFCDAVEKGVQIKTEYLEHFRVLCHGNFLRENLQYSYR